MLKVDFSSRSCALVGTRFTRTGAEPAPAFSGERGVWAAVIEQAVIDVQPCNLTPPGVRRDAERWFCSEARGVGTLEYACDVLGLEADAIRDALVRLLTRNQLHSNFPQVPR